MSDEDDERSIYLPPEDRLAAQRRFNRIRSAALDKIASMPVVASGAALMDKALEGKK